VNLGAQKTFSKLVSSFIVLTDYPIKVVVVNVIETDVGPLIRL